MASNVEHGRESFQDSGPRTVTPETRLGGRAANEPPLCLAQERVWFSDQLCAGKPVNNMGRRLEFRGAVDVAALESAANLIIERHASFRTVFLNQEGRLSRKLLPAKPVKIAPCDLSEFPESERERAAIRIAEAAVRDPFDLAGGPLVRLQLLRLSPERYWLVIVMHSIAGDETSLEILLQELTTQTARQHASYVLVERHEEASESDLQYWKEKLSGKLPALDLPTDRPRPAMQTWNGATVPLNLSTEVTRELEACARREGVTLRALLLAVFKAVLHRYTGQEDIIVGARVSGRTPENERAIGTFASTLPIRVGVSAEMPFRELLLGVQQSILDAERYAIPFEKLVDVVPPERDLSRSPLFQVFFAFEEKAGDATAIHTGTTQYDLTLSLRKTADNLRGIIEFNSDLLERATIERLCGHFSTLLTGVIEDSARPVGRLPLVTPAEREQILVEWNATERPYPQDKCVQYLFEEQVERTPDAVAAVFEDEEITYRELNRRANAVAAHLQEMGAGPDARVGICIGRSLEMLIGLLGILKAGAAYVPLDPTYPSERLAFMVEDAQVHALLTTRHLAAGFHATKTRVLLVEEIAPGERDENAHSEATPENLAYVIYTSGSTGKPKGVMIRHRNVANFFAGMDDVLGTTPGTWLAVTSICFDIHVLELLWTTARGFKVVIQSDEAGMRAPAAGSTANGRSRGGYTIPEQIDRHQVTHFQCTPSLMGMLLQEPDAKEAAAKLDTVLVGGEPLTPTLLEQLTGPRRIVNVYGPTETTVWSTSQVIEPNGPITVGRPLANQSTYILDRFGEPTPVGIPGELFIGGDGVVRGYHNRPELTAERFVMNSFAKGAGQRMYRTGDLAKYRADGKIDFLGRLDYQVKVRGFRIELGEIESALRKVGGVREAVVVVREVSATDKRLAAYLVADKSVDAAQLKRALKERLPDYMVPSFYTFLEALPLTPNGKIDRKALPEPEGLRAASATAFMAPQSETEHALAGIWREVLRVERVGVNDNFFELGGRSLLLLQVQAKIAVAFDKQLSLAQLFQNPTISGLAKLIGDAPLHAAQLDDAERHKILVEWNRTELAYPREACIHELFETQVERTPDAVAAIYNRQEITYCELNRRANQLANYLRTLGVGPDVFVGLCVERSFALLVGALGIFKAGGAYVPLDWTYPPERVRFMLDDTKAPLVLTQHSLLQHVPPSATRLVCLDSDWERIAEHDTTNPQKIGRSSDMAYVMYTSGSTGVSKGVALEHRSAVSFIHWAREVFSAEEIAGVLASTSICFDLSIFELFVPLSWGGAVVLADNAVDLPALPPNRSITLINTVPSAIKDLLKKSAIPSSVSVVNLAGEKLRTEVVNQLYALPQIKKVYDLYGPSEATTYATWTMRKANAPATVGRPVANTQIYILDSDMQPCPVGVTGEIYIGGDCLARGYINRAELTAERFVADPFRTGGRLYKTGDLGRYFPDGNIDFLGRKDHQVKIRGYRIELGEIEAVLAQHPAVQECVAAVRDGDGEEKQLTAYIVPQRNGALTASEVRRFLRERLPDYMVPTAFVALTALPLTSNGKVNRQALPQPTPATLLQEEGSRAVEMTPVQEAVAEIWRKVLGVEKVGLHDDFFDLGGHSVLVTQITSRVRSVFEIDLTMRHLFGAPTVAALSQVVEELLEQQLRQMSLDELHQLAAGAEKEVA